MFYTKNPIQYSNISVYIYLKKKIYWNEKKWKMKKLEIVLLQESAKNKFP